MSELIRSEGVASPSHVSPYQSACTFCFRVEIRRYVMLSTEQAGLKFISQTSQNYAVRVC